MSTTSSITFQGDVVKCSIPKELYLAIAKTQVELGLGWDEACIKSAQLMNTGNETFKKSVATEARRLHDSELMSEINKARKTIKEKAFQQGLEEARTNENNFSVNCHKCGKPMYFSDRHSNWDKVTATLDQAFLNWNHAGE